MRKEHKNPSGGLSAKGRAYYNRKTGSKLKAPVTEKNLRVNEQDERNPSVQG